MSGVSETPVFEAARDCSLAGEGGAEMANVPEVIGGLPETTMNNNGKGPCPTGNRNSANW